MEGRDGERPHSLAHGWQGYEGYMPERLRPNPADQYDERRQMRAERNDGLYIDHFGTAWHDTTNRHSALGPRRSV